MQDGCWPFHLFGANFVTESDARKFVFVSGSQSPLKAQAKPSTFRGKNAIQSGD